MQPRNVSDEQLIFDLKKLVQKERTLIAQILEYLREVEHRKLYLARGYSSMFAFCTECLGYSEPEAQIRIQAMRLSRDVPEIQSQIASGELSLSVAALAQSAFRNENGRRAENDLPPLSPWEKKHIINELSGSTKQVAREKLAKTFGEPVKVKLTFEAEEDLLRDLDELKGLLASQNYSGDLGNLIRIMTKNMLKQVRKNKPVPELEYDQNRSIAKLENLSTTTLDEGPSNPPTQLSEDPSHSPAQLGEDPSQSPTQVSEDPNQSSVQFSEDPIHSPIAKQLKSNPKITRSRYIDAQTRRKVWQKSNARCTYVDPITGRQCGSRHGLEIDHIHEFAKGGSNDLENLRLLCSAHNKFRNYQRDQCKGLKSRSS